MIDKNAFVSRAELEIRGRRTASPSTCELWRELPIDERTAFARAMAFLGCQMNGMLANPAIAIPEIDRVAAARLMLLKLGLDTDDPKWSSEMLERFAKAVIEAPGGCVGDLFAALFGVLADFNPELTKPVANFIKDVVVVCFTRYRASYDSVDWGRFAEDLGGASTKSQLYLALHAIPPQYVSPELANTIVAGLASTAFHDEAANAIAV